MNIKVGVLAAATAALLIAPAQADWDPTDPAPWKWVQMPNETTMGYDVAVGYIGTQRMVADDFLCTLSGPITDIHLWMSYQYDMAIVPPMLQPFRLRIWSDFAIDNPDNNFGYSMPLEPLWERIMLPTAVRLWSAGVPETWWDPVTGTMASDFEIWQFNFEPIERPFSQIANTVYWLSVEALGDPNVYDDHIGWKTAATQWNDDAVFWVEDQTGAGQWIEMHDPFFPDESLDMAFVITTPEPATYGLIAGLGLIGFVVLRRRVS